MPVADAGALHEALQRGCGLLGRVRKQRQLLMVGLTRIHLDRADLYAIVEALGGLHVILTEYHDSHRVDRQLFHRRSRDVAQLGPERNQMPGLDVRVG